MQNVFFELFVRILGAFLYSEVLLVHSANFRWATQPLRHSRGVHIATTVLPHQELQYRPFLIPAEITELTEPAQCKATLRYRDLAERWLCM